MGCLSELLRYLPVRAPQNTGDSPESRNYVYQAGNMRYMHLKGTRSQSPNQQALKS